MRRSGVAMRVPDAHEIFSASVDEQRDRAVGLIRDDAQILASRIDGPGLHFSKPVRGRVAHGIFDSGIVPDLHCRVVPPVETLAHITAIAQADPLLQHCGARTENELHAPFHSIHTVDIAHRDGSTSVIVGGEGKIHGRHGHPVVGDGKIKLNSESSPGTPVADPGFLDGRVGVEHRLPAELVDTGVNVSADIRQHGTFQILVLQENCAQGVLLTLFGNFLSQRVGIAEPVAGKLVKRGIGIRRSLLVDGKSSAPSQTRTCGKAACAVKSKPRSRSFDRIDFTREGMDSRSGF